jgi:hypothetical protein
MPTAWTSLRADDKLYSIGGRSYDLVERTSFVGVSGSLRLTTAVPSSMSESLRALVGDTDRSPADGPEVGYDSV